MNRTPSVVALSAPRPVEVPESTREQIFRTPSATLLRVRTAGGDSTSWHRHARDAYGVVVEGSIRIEYGEDGSDAITVGPEEFFSVPAGVVHREVNRDAGACVALVAHVGDRAETVIADGPAATPDGAAPRRAGASDLVPAESLPNVTRLTPFPDAAVQQVRGRAAGRIESGWHHHGDNDVFGHVLRGEGYVEWGDAPGERELARAGEFFFVPAGAVHRDANPSDEEQEYVLWLTGTEPRVVLADAPGGR